MNPVSLLLGSGVALAIGWAAMVWLAAWSPEAEITGSADAQSAAQSVQAPTVGGGGGPGHRVTGAAKTAVQADFESPTNPPDPDPSDLEPVWDGPPADPLDLGPPLDADLAWMVENASAEAEPVDLGLPLDADATPASEPGAAEPRVDLGEPLDADAHLPAQGLEAAEWGVVDLGEPLDADAPP